MELSSSFSGNRETPGVEDDGGIYKSTVGLAKEAALLFESRRYADCVDILNKLSQKKGNDPKVFHNITVAKYFSEGFKDPRRLLDALHSTKVMLQRRTEDLVPAGEPGEGGNCKGNTTVISAGSKGSNNVTHQFGNANGSRLSYREECDVSVATLNAAVIHFYIHDYVYASSLLEPLYRNLEPIDETTAIHICLLLLDVSLASHDASKAADVIQYLEKALGVGYTAGQGENGMATQHHSSSQSSRVPFVSIGLTASDSSNSDIAPGANSSDTQLTRSLSDEGLEIESLLNKFDIGGQNMSRQSISSANALTERAGSAVDLKLKLHLCKVRLLLLTRNLKAAKREIKVAILMARGRDSSALLLKSQLEYARGNFRKAIKLLENSGNKPDEGMSSMFYNNLGCIYHHLRKPHTANLFFSKALKSSSLLHSEKPKKLATLSQDKSLLIVYNCGVQHLVSGKPLVASKCFQKASLIFYRRPLLWIRLAECCLLALEKGFLKSGRSVSAEEVDLHVIGKGKWQQMIVEDATMRSRHMSSGNGLVREDDVQRKISMPYARQCLLNALHLLSEHEKKPSSSEEDAQIVPFRAYGDSKSSSTGAFNSTFVVANGDIHRGVTGLHSTLQSSVSAYSEICRKENHLMRQVVLADLAYVELALENPLKALSAASDIMQLPDCSTLYMFLGHVYAAEALCWLNRPVEAAKELSIYVSGGVHVGMPYTEDDWDKWRSEKLGGVIDCEETNSTLCPTRSSGSMEESSHFIAFLKPEESRGVLLVNLAAISAMRGDAEQAHKFILEALSLMPGNSRVVLGAVYVDLLLGKAQDALAKLKECRHVRIYPTDVMTH